MSHDTELTPQTAIGLLLASFATIDLENTKLPKMGEPCRHFKKIGVINDHTKRLLIHAHARFEEHQEEERKFRFKVPRHSEPSLKQSDNDLRSVVDEYQLGYARRERYLHLLSCLLESELEQQFPDMPKAAFDEPIIGEDGTIGWNDHSGLGKEFIQIIVDFVHPARRGF